MGTREDHEFAENLHAICVHCNHRWIPYDKTEVISRPHEDTFKCPNCNKVTEIGWLTEEMQKERMYKKYVLGYDERTKNTEKKNRELTKDRDEWKKRYEKTFEINIKLSNSLERITKKLEELGVEVDNDDKNKLAGYG